MNFKQYQSNEPTVQIWNFSTTFIFFVLYGIGESRKIKSNQPTNKMTNISTIFLNEKCLFLQMKWFLRIRRIWNECAQCQNNEYRNHFLSNWWQIGWKMLHFHVGWILQIKRIEIECAWCQNGEYHNYFRPFSIKLVKNWMKNVAFSRWVIFTN